MKEARILSPESSIGSKEGTEDTRSFSASRPESVFTCLTLCLEDWNKEERDLRFIKDETSATPAAKNRAQASREDEYNKQDDKDKEISDERKSSSETMLRDNNECPRQPKIERELIKFSKIQSTFSKKDAEN